jgi:uncharacterized heparinase superfamily protein
MVTMDLYKRRVSRAHLGWRAELLGLYQVAETLRARLHADKDPELAKRTAAIARGYFEFLDEPGELGWPPNWAVPFKPQLWRYHLHYFDNLLDLALSPDRPVSLALDLIRHWIDANPIHGRGATRDAWHPYVVSIRIVNWMLSLSAMVPGADVPDLIRSSLAEHALFLERNLETDVGGNHLLKNLKAMVFASCFWSGSQADLWRRRFSSWFVQELGCQLLSDGGHYERSPMYHSQVFADALEVAALLMGCCEVSIDSLLSTIDRMDQFLTEVTHPDGQIALFNDSAFNMAPPPPALHCAADGLRAKGAVPTTARLELLLEQGRPQTRKQQGVLPRTAARVVNGIAGKSSSGYVQIPQGQSDRYLLADVGAVCPDDLPAHAHADLLSFEMSLGARRMIVDSGVGEYAAGPLRDYYRSTRAHNTVMIDACEQSDCWASFRVGRRASPANVCIRVDGDLTVLQAEHTGYDHLFGRPRHRREFLWSSDGFWIVADTIVGEEEHTWTSFCHFHPEVAIISEGESWIRVAREDVVLDVCWYGFKRSRCVRGQSDEIQGWYAERFGLPVPAHVLTLDGQGTVPAHFGYALVPKSCREDDLTTVRMRAPDMLEIGMGSDNFRFVLSPFAELSR